MKKQHLYVIKFVRHYKTDESDAVVRAKIGRWERALSDMGFIDEEVAPTEVTVTDAD